MNAFEAEDVFKMIMSGLGILQGKKSNAKSPSRFRPDMYWPRKTTRLDPIDWNAYCEDLFTAQ